MNDSVLSQLARMDLDRIKGYKELLDFYYGRQWEGKGQVARAAPDIQLRQGIYRESNIIFDGGHQLCRRPL